MMLLSLLMSFGAGLFSHFVYYKWLTVIFRPLSARLVSIGLWTVLDIFSSWFVFRSHEKSLNDRRKGPPISFDRYLYIRAVAGVLLWVGVVFGHMISPADDA